MRRSMVVLLYLILPMTLLSAQSLSAPASDSTTSSTSTELRDFAREHPEAWAALEEEIAQEEQAMMLEAANTAVKLHIVYEATLKDDISKQERKTKTWRAVGISGWFIALALTIIALLK